MQDKVIVITGASEGIGAVTAEHLAARRARVVLAARRPEKLAEVDEPAEIEAGFAQGR